MPPAAKAGGGGQSVKKLKYSPLMHDGLGMRGHEVGVELSLGNGIDRLHCCFRIVDPRGNGSGLRQKVTVLSTCFGDVEELDNVEAAAEGSEEHVSLIVSLPSSSSTITQGTE